MFPTSQQHDDNEAPPLTTAPIERKRQPAEGSRAPPPFSPFVVTLVARRRAALWMGGIIIVSVSILGIGVREPVRRGGARLPGPDEEGHRPPHPAPEVPRRRPGAEAEDTQRGLAARLARRRRPTTTHPPTWSTRSPLPRGSIPATGTPDADRDRDHNVATLITTTFLPRLLCPLK